MRLKTALFLIFFGIISSNLWAQQMPYYPDQGNKSAVNPFRSFLNKFSLGISSGYGQSFYWHDLAADQLGPYYLLKREDRLLLGLTNDSNSRLYNEWMQKLASDTPQPYRQTGDVVLFSDSSSYTFHQMAFNIPLLLNLNFEYKRFRIGGGAGIEYQRFQTVKSAKAAELLGEFYTEPFSNWAYRYFLSAGYNFYTFKTLVFDYLFVADFQAGMYNYGKAFDLPSGNTKPYFNLGLSMEKQYSKYFRAFIRPAFEYKSYLIPMEGEGLEPSEPVEPIKHQNLAFYVQGGIYLKFPKLKRCPIDACHIQVEHKHFGKHYRGQPIYKKQNRKYGENNRTLLKYKRKYQDKNLK